MSQHIEISGDVVLIFLDNSFNEDFEKSGMSLLDYRNKHTTRCSVMQSYDQSLKPGERALVFSNHKHFAVAFKSSLIPHEEPDTPKQIPEGGENK